jgi:hypothetical protein
LFDAAGLTLTRVLETPTYSSMAIMELTARPLSESESEAVR